VFSSTGLCCRLLLDEADVTTYKKQAQPGDYINTQSSPIQGARFNHFPHGNQSLKHITMSSSTPPSSLGQPISEKLTCDNFILWKLQLVPIVCGAQLFGFIDGTVVESARSDAAHGAWVVQDQQVLGFINASLLQEVLGHVATCTTSAAVWRELTTVFASQSCVRMI
jgi:hypothetical protein